MVDLRCVCALLLTVAPIPAQITITSTTVDAWTIDGQTIAAGTDVSNGAILSSVWTDPQSLCDLSASVALTTGSGSLTLTTTASSTNCSVAPGPGPFRLDVVLTAPAPTYATFTLSAENTHTPFEGNVALFESTDFDYVLGAPPGVFAGPPGVANDSWSAVVGPQGTTIRAIVDMPIVGGTSRCTLGVVAGGPAPTVTVTPVGNACGPVLSGTVLPRPDAIGALRLEVANSQGYFGRFYSLGSNDLSIPLPVTGCEILTEIFVVFLPTGLAPSPPTRDVTLPLGLGTTDVRVQYFEGLILPTGEWSWQTSNALRVQLP